MADEPKSYVLQNMIDDCVQIVEIRRIGQRYCFDSDGVGYPRYVYDAQPVAKLDTMEEAKAYMAGLERGKWGDPEHVTVDIERHPTFTMSVGGPGVFPLDGEGGPLYMTNTDMPGVFNYELLEDKEEEDK